VNSRAPFFVKQPVPNSHVQYGNGKLLSAKPFSDFALRISRRPPKPTLIYVLCDYFGITFFCQTNLQSTHLPRLRNIFPPSHDDIKEQHHPDVTRQRFSGSAAHLQPPPSFQTTIKHHAPFRISRLGGYVVRLDEVDQQTEAETLPRDIELPEIALKTNRHDFESGFASR
jgi:hypothetical protein